MVLIGSSFAHIFKTTSRYLANLHDLVSDLKIQIASSALATGLHLDSTIVKYFIEVAVMAFHGTASDSIFVF